MTRREIGRLIGGIRFGPSMEAFKPFVHANFCTYPASTVVVEVGATVRDRDTGDTLVLYGGLLCVSPDEQPEALILRVRQALSNLLTHELDEGFLLAGSRVFDPHHQTDGEPGLRDACKEALARENRFHDDAPYEGRRLGEHPGSHGEPGLNTRGNPRARSHPWNP